MKLIGSTTSPYVRRIRLLLDWADRPYEFIDLNIYDTDRDELRRHNPALKIPVLYDEEQVIYDSRVISRYLSEKLGLDALSWERENQLTLIDAANDSMVTLLLMMRSEIDVSEERMFFKLQHERIASALTALEGLENLGEFKHWDYPAICLLSMLDWGLFRQLIDPAKYPGLAHWVSTQQNQTGVRTTDPRLA